MTAVPLWIHQVFVQAEFGFVIFAFNTLYLQEGLGYAANEFYCILFYEPFILLMFHFFYRMMSVVSANTVRENFNKGLVMAIVINAAIALMITADVRLIYPEIEENFFAEVLMVEYRINLSRIPKPNTIPVHYVHAPGFGSGPNWDSILSMLNCGALGFATIVFNFVCGAIIMKAVRNRCKFRKNCSVSMGSKEIPSYAHRPVNPAKEEVPLGEGQFLIKWKGVRKADWIGGDNVIRHGPEAVRRYFTLVRRRRALAVKYLNRLTHISSLNDIICGGITDESETHYKMVIAGPSPAFARELIHPEWGKHITRTFQIVRENGVAYVWVNRIQAQYIFRRTVHNFERRKRVMPSPEEINTMNQTDREVHEKRKAEGYYIDEDDECSDAEDRAQPMYK
ncbi:hypothetical protein PRIPAC_82425 [Pristionchus pacificus]|uniref:G protein-coupled receptor n=1 Tax=Pristionchus pacificus TaxID=54126 RepID=A0A2A6CK63_PRIPA|nr:hypothetical protein PRIPAC_82425 [Pristionchus pacificus]|eukprot:PDM78478.1 G protein-coupled receptor [Pristionchus pacificus]